jgi:hypothetical protein
MSPINYNEAFKLEQFGPRVGEKLVIHIRSCERVQDPDNSNERNYYESKTKHAGFRDEFILTNGRVFYLNNWKLNKEFARNKVTDGDKIEIDHVGSGQYKVTVLERGTGIGLTVPDIEKELYNQCKNDGALVDKKVPDAYRAKHLPALQEKFDGVSEEGSTEPEAPAPVSEPAAETPKAASKAAVTKQAQPVVEDDDDDIDLPF